MAELNRYEMRSILTYLDRALADTRRTDHDGFEGNASWNIRTARDLLLEAAISPVSVEQLGPIELRQVA